MPHQGQILQEAIKNSGISITRIVDELGITRPTIYRKFKDETLDYAFVTRIGEIIGHDFSNDFTVLQQSVIPFVTTAVAHSSLHSPLQPVTSKSVTPPAAEQDYAKQLMALQTKYIALLEAYNELLLKVYGPR
jgi:AcrR family transcriptional regulator